MGRIKSMLSFIMQRPLYEKIFFFISLISVLGVMIYTVCCLPYIGNSETYVPLVMARDCIRTKSVLSPSFVHRNAISSFTSHLLLIVPALFTDSTAVCTITVFMLLILGGSSILIYCSQKVSQNNCWLIFLSIFWCGISVYYIKYMFLLFDYMLSILIMFLVYALVSSSLDNELKITSWKKMILASILILLSLTSGLRQIQIFTIPVIGGMVIYYVIRHLGDDSLSKVIKNKSFKNLIICVGIIFLASAIGYLIYYILVNQEIVKIVFRNEGVMRFTRNIGENIHTLLLHFMGISDAVNNLELFSIKGVCVFAKVLINIFMLIVFPVMQLKKYKNESVAMQLFMLIAIIHVAEIIFLSVFCSALSAERYLYSSILLLYYISAHYIFNHILQSEKHFGIKALIAVAAAFVFSVPSSLSLAMTAKNYKNNIANSHVVTDFLENKGLSYGYGTYWNSDNFTALSNFKVRVSKVSVYPEKIIPHLNGVNVWEYDYREEAYQGSTFLLLEDEENKNFLASENYTRLGEPAEVCNISKYTIYIYDYNIANNNFRGEYAGFTGSELEKISAACRENNVDIALVYDAGHVTSILRGDIDNIDEVSGDTTILVVTRESLAEPANKLNADIGEFGLYVCKMSELEYTPNPNYVAGSDFNSNDDLTKWAIGGGETAVCDNGVLTITCTRESDRRFNQTITISEEQVGNFMTFSFKVNKVSGDHVSRVYGDDFSENRYITATITEPGIYSFTFVPTSTQVTVQPIVPSALGSSAEIEWVKLENGNIFTGYVPFAADTNLAEGSDSQDSGDREDLVTDDGGMAAVNPNLAAGSDFQNSNDLDAWAIGGGESAICDDGVLLLTCIEEKDRRFDQIIKISKEQVGKPMTLSYEINSIDGYVLTRVWGEDYTEDRWLTETISEPGEYVFTFIPTSEEFTIRPALPEKLNNSVSVEWVKLETGSDATDFVPYAA